MSSSILHRCPFCGHVTDISEALAAFVETPHCNQCGLSASESNLKLQNDLVALFNTQMNIGTPSTDNQQIQPSAAPITYSITQHYHHSSHVVQQSTTPKIPTGVLDYGIPNGTTDILKHHGINPSSLSEQQLELFRNAIPEQQSRLIQIWQICPEHTGGSEKASTLNNEANSTQDLVMCDSSRGRDIGDDNRQYAEPYMISGYEMADREPLSPKDIHLLNEPTSGSPYRPSNDPIYQNQGQRWWERTQPDSMEY